MRTAAKVELRFGGRALGSFSRGELLELNATIACILEVDKDLALAWLGLSTEQREQVGRIVDAVLGYFEQVFASGGGQGARERRLACGLIREMLPDMPIAAVAAAVRLSVSTVEANVRWMKAWERGSKSVRRELNQLRAFVRKGLCDGR